MNEKFFILCDNDVLAGGFDTIDSALDYIDNCKQRDNIMYVIEQSKKRKIDGVVPIKNYLLVKVIKEC